MNPLLSLQATWISGPAEVPAGDVWASVVVKGRGHEIDGVAGAVKLEPASPAAGSAERQPTIADHEVLDGASGWLSRGLRCRQIALLRLRGAVGELALAVRTAVRCPPSDHHQARG